MTFGSLYQKLWHGNLKIDNDKDDNTNDKANDDNIHFLQLYKNYMYTCDL